MSLLCWRYRRRRQLRQELSAGKKDGRNVPAAKGDVRLISRYVNLGTSWSGLPQGRSGGWGAWFPLPPWTNRTNEATRKISLPNGI